MKNIFFALAALIISASASAATMDTCLEHVNNKCAALVGADLHNILNLDRRTECKIISGGTTARGAHFNERVAFFDKNTLFSVELLPNLFGICPASTAQLSGRVVDSAVFNGRLYFAHSSNRVVVIGRNNAILEMLTSGGDSYVSVTGVKVTTKNGQRALTLEREHNQKTTLSEEQLSERLNSTRTTRALSY